MIGKQLYISEASSLKHEVIPVYNTELQEGKEESKKMTMKNFKYRIYPNKAIAEKLQWTLDRCRELYNAALEERREAYRMSKISVSYNMQSAQLPAIKELRPEYKEIFAQILQDTLRRLDKTFNAFFRRYKKGEKSGFPRFQGKGRYDSFTYPQITPNNGPSFRDKKLNLPKIGCVKIKLHRPIEGKIKTCTIKREGDEWYVYFSCEVETETLPLSYEDVGIDLGITHFAACSDGSMIDSPRHYRRAEKRLKKLQEALSRKKRGSHRRKKATKAVARAHRKVRNQRKDFHHKESRKLVNKYQVIVFEDLQSANLSKRPKAKQDEDGKYLPNGAAAKGGLNKSILDAGWNAFTEMVKYKAANAGRTVIFVNPAYTSQACSGCGTVKKKDLSERWHSCECGVELDRDVNAAINILRLGHSLQAVQAA